MVKEPACQCRSPRDAGVVPGSGRSPGGRHGNPLPLTENPTENPLDRIVPWRSLVGYIPEGPKESDRIEAT